MTNFSAKYSENEPISMHDTFPIKWERAHGANIWDDEGKKYIDFTSGIFVANVGHSNRTVEKYLKQQIKKQLWFSFAFPTNIRKEFIDEITSISPNYLNKCCVFSDGSMANEAAIKLARQHTKKYEIISYSGSYHGNTHMLQTLKIKLPFPTKGQSFKDHINLIPVETTAAIILEGYQGWSAFFYEKEYIKELVTWCNKNNIVVIIDEIQSGFGRTGKMFCFYHYEIEPDMVVFGKGVSSSLPLSGVLGREKIMNALNGVELMSNTHSGNCLSMAAGLGSLKELQKIDLEQVSKNGDIMQNVLEKLKNKYNEHIVQITGKGLLAAIHFKDKELCDKITLKSIQNGVMLVRTRKGTVKIGPPLIISKRNLLKALNIIDESIKQCIN